MTVIKVYECCLHRKCYQKSFVTVCSLQGVQNLKTKGAVIAIVVVALKRIIVVVEDMKRYHSTKQYIVFLKFAKLYHEKSFEIQLVETYVLWFSDYHCCLTPLGLAA